MAGLVLGYGWGFLPGCGGVPDSQVEYAVQEIKSAVSGVVGRIFSLRDRSGGKGGKLPAVPLVKDLLNHYRALSPQELEEEFKQFLRTPRYVEGETLKLSETMILSRMGEVMPKRALEMLLEYGIDESTAYYRQVVFAGWASRDPRSAATFYEENRDALAPNIDSLPHGSESAPESLPATIGREWFHRNEKEALAWMETLRPSERADMRLALIEDLAKLDRERALEQWARLPLADRAKAEPGILCEWIAEDPHAVQAWMDAHDVPLSRREKAYATLAINDPETAVAFFGQSMSSMEESDSKTRVSIMDSLTDAAPLFASQLIATFGSEPFEKQKRAETGEEGEEEEDVRDPFDSGYSEGHDRKTKVFAALSAQYPDKALEQIQSMPSGEERNKYLYALIGKSPIDYMAKNLQLLDMLEGVSSEERHDMRNALLRRWYDFDHEEARPLIESLPLSEEEREFILAPREFFNDGEYGPYD